MENIILAVSIKDGLDEIVMRWVNLLRTEATHHRLVIALPSYKSALEFMDFVEKSIAGYRNMDWVVARCHELARRDPRGRVPDTTLPVFDAFSTKNKQRIIFEYPFAPMILITTIPVLTTSVWFSPRGEWDAHERLPAAALHAHHSHIVIVGCDHFIDEYWAAWQNMHITLYKLVRNKNPYDYAVSTLSLLTTPVAWSMISATCEKFLGSLSVCDLRSEHNLSVKLSIVHDRQKLISMITDAKEHGDRVFILTSRTTTAHELYHELSDHGKALLAFGTQRRYERNLAVSRALDHDQDWDFFIATSLLNLPRLSFHGAILVCEETTLDVLTLRISNAIADGVKEAIVFSNNRQSSSVRRGKGQADEIAVSELLTHYIEDGILNLNKLERSFHEINGDTKSKVVIDAQMPPVLLSRYVAAWHRGDLVSPDPRLYNSSKYESIAYLVLRTDAAAVARMPQEDTRRYYYEICPISDYEMIPVPLFHAQKVIDDFMGSKEVREAVTVLRYLSDPVPIRKRDALLIYAHDIVRPDGNILRLKGDDIVILPPTQQIVDAINKIATDDEMEDDLKKNLEITSQKGKNRKTAKRCLFRIDESISGDIAEIAHYNDRGNLFIRIRPDDKFTPISELRKALYEIYESQDDEDEMIQAWREKISSFITSQTASRINREWIDFLSTLLNALEQHKFATGKAWLIYPDNNGIVLYPIRSSAFISYRRHLSDGPRTTYLMPFMGYRNTHASPMEHKIVKGDHLINHLLNILPPSSAYDEISTSMRLALRLCHRAIRHFRDCDIATANYALFYHERYAVWYACRILKKSVALTSTTRSLSARVIPNLVFHLIYSHHGAALPFLSAKQRGYYAEIDKNLLDATSDQHIADAVAAFMDIAARYGYWGSAFLMTLFSLSLTCESL